MNKIQKKKISLNTYATANYILYGSFMILFGAMEFVFASKDKGWGTALTMAMAVFLMGKAIWDLKTKREDNDELSQINWAKADRFMIITELIADIVLIVILDILAALPGDTFQLSSVDLRVILPFLLVIKCGFQTMLIGFYFIRFEEN